MKTRSETIAAKPHLEQYVRAPSPAAFYRQHTTQGEAFAWVSDREGNSSGVESTLGTVEGTLETVEGTLGTVEGTSTHGLTIADIGGSHSFLTLIVSISENCRIFAAGNYILILFWT